MSFVTRMQHAFPPPSYLAMYGAGIDISTGSVKSVVLARKGGVPELVSYEKIDLSEGVVVNGDIEKPDALIETLRALRLRNHIHFAHASLLERKSYLYQTLVPKVEKDLRAAVEFSLEGNVPIPPSETAFDFKVVRQVEEGTIVSVTAYAKRIVEAYQDVFKKAGITLRSIEVESQATARAVLATEDMNCAVMLIDFGKRTTRIAIIDSGAVSFTATIDVGGDSLTSAVMKHMKVGEEEAEKIKNKQGFLEGGENTGLHEALMSTVSVFRDELQKHILFWNSPDPDLPRRPLDKAVIVGGNANVKGLPEFLSRSLELPFTTGDVWRNIFSLDEYVPHMPFNESLQYATAVGLAARSFSKTPW